MENIPARFFSGKSSFLFFRCNWLVALIVFGSLVGMPVAFGQTTNGGAAEAFKRLSSLAGDWEGKSSSGHSYTVSYRLIASGSALVEDWKLGPGREAMTVYHLDGDALIATHFCPQGNAPRLQLVKEDEPDKFSFKFRDGTNLQDQKKYHQHFFWIKLFGDDAFERSETYLKNDSTASEIDASTHGKPVKYTRVK